MRLLVVAALVVAAAAAPGVLGAAPPPPALSLTDRQPVTVHGVGFKSGEWVRVTVLATGSGTSRIRASRAGGFSVTFPRLAFGPCAGGQISAVGSRGTIAALKLPRRACMPAKQP
jgi:hypothetical protein